MSYTSYDGTTHFASYTFRKPSLFTRLKRFLLRTKTHDDAVEDVDEREAMEGMRHLSLKALEREERREWARASLEGLERWEDKHGLGERSIT